VLQPVYDIASLSTLAQDVMCKDVWYKLSKIISLRKLLHKVVALFFYIWRQMKMICKFLSNYCWTRCNFVLSCRRRFPKLSSGQKKGLWLQFFCAMVIAIRQPKQLRCELLSQKWQFNWQSISVVLLIANEPFEAFKFFW